MRAPARSVPLARAPQGRPAGCSGERGGVNAEPEAVGQPREVVEDSHHVGDLETAFVVEPDLVQGRPIGGADRVGIGAQLLGDCAERTPPRRERRVGPVPVLDGGRRLIIAPFGTQKLRVRCRSVEAGLRRGRDRREHLSLLAVECAGREHDLREQGLKRRADTWMGHEQPPHPGRKAKVVRVVGGPGCDHGLR